MSDICDHMIAYLSVPLFLRLIHEQSARFFVALDTEGLRRPLSHLPKCPKEDPGAPFDDISGGHWVQVSEREIRIQSVSTSYGMVVFYKAYWV